MLQLLLTHKFGENVNVNVNVRERFYWSPVSKFQRAAELSTHALLGLSPDPTRNIETAG